VQLSLSLPAEEEEEGEEGEEGEEVGEGGEGEEVGEGGEGEGVGVPSFFSTPANMSVSEEGLPPASPTCRAHA
jgi:hypothetical protein